MEEKVVWLFVFVALYWAYCIFWGVRGALTAKTASDYFIAGRRLSIWVFVLAATATSFSGWTFMGHPGLIYRDGFQYAYASFYAITIPFTGVIFLKRQWMLGKRFGYVTPGEMLSDYFQGDMIRILVVVVALLFSIPYLGVQLGASGFLFNVLTDDLISRDIGMWVLSAVVLIYVASGGLRAVAYVDTLQCILLAFGIISIGLIAYSQLGGWGSFNDALAKLGKETSVVHHITIDSPGSGYETVPTVTITGDGTGATAVAEIDERDAVSEDGTPILDENNEPSVEMVLSGITVTRPGSEYSSATVIISGGNPITPGTATAVIDALGKWGGTKEGHNAYLAIPGVIQFTAGLGKEKPVGGLWTGIMVLTYMFALMGIQSAPAFSMWSFANADPTPFAPQQVWASAFGIGAILFFFTAAQGVGAHFLGATPSVSSIAGIESALPDLTNERPDSLVPHYINLVGDAAPWFVGLLAVCALAAMQSTGAAYMSTAGGMLTRDLYKRYINPEASHTTQKLFGRIGVAFIVISALLVATFSQDALVLLGGLAVAFGFQMWPSLAAVCWIPWITRQGASWGLVAGLLAVIFTEQFGMAIAGSLSIDLPWGRWPWTIHSAGWGMIFNLAVCIVVSARTQTDSGRTHRMTYHNFLREHASLPASKKSLVPVAWIVTIAWLFFGIGPGAVIGNTIFGAPNEGPGGWTFGIPSIWAWQILFWIFGVAMMWFLAYKMELSAAPRTKIEPLTDDIGDK